MVKIFPTDFPSKTTPAVSWDAIIWADSQDWNKVKAFAADLFKGPKGDKGDPWLKGDKGDPWLKGDKWDKGDIGINWKGAYNSTTAYVINDWVSYNGSSYICIQNTTWNLPINTTYWDLVAQKGIDWTWSGDMSKSTYDTNNNGIIDNSETLNWQTPAYYLNTDNHTDWTINWVYTLTERTKLNWIETWAQVNTVNSVAGKTWNVSLVKADVWLWNVDNTSDLAKPISTATQNALNTKQDVLWYIAEDQANKSTSTTLWTSDILYPTQNAVKTYVDNKVLGWWSITTLDMLEIAWTQTIWIVSNYRVSQAWTLAKFSAYLETAPTGADFIADLQVNWTTQATATITDWTTSWTTTTFTSNVLAEWDLITYNITQVGSSVAGSDLTLLLNLA